MRPGEVIPHDASESGTLTRAFFRLEEFPQRVSGKCGEEITAVDSVVKIVERLIGKLILTREQQESD